MRHQRLAVSVDVGDHLRGPERAPITVVEYGHFQSADGAALHPCLQDILRRWAPLVRLVYRHFPLPVSDLHPYKMVAAQVAEAAAARDRFWPMHDWLFEHQHEIDRSSLREAELLLDLPALLIDVEISQRVYHERIMRDVNGGWRSGVTDVPTLFINDERLPVGPAADDLMHDLMPALDRALDAATDALSSEA